MVLSRFRHDDRVITVFFCILSRGQGIRGVGDLPLESLLVRGLCVLSCDALEFAILVC